MHQFSEQLADRYGRKKILALSISWNRTIIYFICNWNCHQNLPLMFIARALDGASENNISVAQAVIGDISSPQSRAKNFGLIGMAFGLGFILGPFIGGKLSDPNLVSWFNSATPFWFAAVLSTINVILVIRLLPETLHIRSENRIDFTRPIHNIIKSFHINGFKSIIPTLLFNAVALFILPFWGL